MEIYFQIFDDARTLSKVKHHHFLPIKLQAVMECERKALLPIYCRKTSLQSKIFQLKGRKTGIIVYTNKA